MTASCLAILFLNGATLAAGAVSPTKPHVVLFLVDDLGWGNVGWHRPDLPKEVKTPGMDQLVADGVELERFYSFKYCGPARSALQTGRNPIHVDVTNGRGDLVNPNDPVSGFSGIPRNMTGLAAKLSSGGYATHAVGKWDVGIATIEHTPLGRGYDTFLGYFGHCNDYWNMQDKCGMGTCGLKTDMLDLWEQNRSEAWSSRPATSLINPSSCSQNAQSGCVFEDELFYRRTLQIVQEHPLDGTPLFLFWSTHGIHGPREVPEAKYDEFSGIDHQGRRTYASLVNYVDDLVSGLVGVLQERGMWQDTLFLMSSDNGGDGVGNNWPLRGAKFSNWEGGIHVPAFVSGGALPQAARGTQLSGLATLWDFYGTLCEVAGVSAEDEAAAVAGLPAVDSVSQWSYWSGATTTAPRDELAIGAVKGSSHGTTANPVTIVEGLIQGDYKLLVGTLEEAVWTGPQFPNKSSDSSMWDVTADCSSGCLFNLLTDPTEHVDLATEQPDRVLQMLARIQELTATAFSPNRGKKDPLGCEAAVNLYGGIWGPFVGIGPIPAPSPSPIPAPTPAPPAPPPTPVSDACAATCSADCPWDDYASYNDCLKCTLHSSKALSACKPKERRAYCQQQLDARVI